MASKREREPEEMPQIKVQRQSEAANELKVALRELISTRLKEYDASPERKISKDFSTEVIFKRGYGMYVAFTRKSIGLDDNWELRVLYHNYIIERLFREEETEDEWYEINIIDCLTKLEPHLGQTGMMRLIMNIFECLGCKCGRINKEYKHLKREFNHLDICICGIWLHHSLFMDVENSSRFSYEMRRSEFYFIYYKTLDMLSYGSPTDRMLTQEQTEAICIRGRVQLRLEIFTLLKWVEKAKTDPAIAEVWKRDISPYIGYRQDIDIGFLEDIDKEWKRKLALHVDSVLATTGTVIDNWLPSNIDHNAKLILKYYKRPCESLIHTNMLNEPQAGLYGSRFYGYRNLACICNNDKTIDIYAKRMHCIKTAIGLLSKAKMQKLSCFPSQVERTDLLFLFESILIPLFASKFISFTCRSISPLGYIPNSHSYIQHGSSFAYMLYSCVLFKYRFENSKFQTTLMSRFTWITSIVESISAINNDTTFHQKVKQRSQSGSVSELLSSYSSSSSSSSSSSRPSPPVLISPNSNEFNPLSQQLLFYEKFLNSLEPASLVDSQTQDIVNILPPFYQ